MQQVNYRDKAYLPIQTVNADPFFTEVFQNGQFQYADPKEVNMIDQMLIALAYFEENGDIEPNFDNFLQTELASKGKNLCSLWKRNEETEHGKRIYCRLCLFDTVF